MTITSIEQLENEIERLVKEHISACEVAVATAVRRAFQSREKSPQEARPTKAAQAKPKKTGPHRSPEEVAALGERFYEVVSKKPGEMMQVLAAEVGVPASQLRQPVVLLKRAGRVRTAGQRQFTRYFPMAAPAQQQG